jgi:hypothetical protein
MIATGIRITLLAVGLTAGLSAQYGEGNVTVIPIRSGPGTPFSVGGLCVERRRHQDAGAARRAGQEI